MKILDPTNLVKLQSNRVGRTKVPTLYQLGSSILVFTLQHKNVAIITLPCNNMRKIQRTEINDTNKSGRYAPQALLGHTLLTEQNKQGVKTQS